MWSTLAQIGPITLHNYGLMIAVGFFLCLHFGMRETDRLGLNRDTVSMHAMWALVLGIAGTRLLHIIMFPAHYSWNDPLGWVAVWRGGLVFQGCLPVVPLYLYWASRRMGISFLKVLDLALTLVPLGQAFGRIGCFLHGCCFGGQTTLPWGVCFPKGSPVYMHHMDKGIPPLPLEALHSYPVHPTQLYSVAALLTMAAVLWYVRRKALPFDGFVIACYCWMDGTQRFIIEMFRDDDNPRNLGLGYLTNQQVFCLLLVAFGTGLYVYLRSRNRAACAKSAQSA